MNRTALRRVAVPGVAVLALGAAATGCGAANESGGSGGASGTLSGSGSSAQASAMDAWRAGFQKQNGSATVNYDPAGSGAGVEKFNGGGVDFAGSDAALDPSKGEVAAAKKRCGADALEVPDYVSPIAVVYHVDGVSDLKLDAKTLAGIFAGKITKWDDPAIKALNSGAKLPSEPISVVHRSDESGTTKNFTDYLSKAGQGAWTAEPDKVWPSDLKGGEGANQTSGMVSAVKQGKGSIGYADLSAAKDLSQAQIKVGNAFEKPTADGAAKAVEASPTDNTRSSGDLVVNIDRTTTAQGAYPLMLTSYLIACPTYSKDKASLVKGFLSYVVSTQGQQAAADNAGSAPLPASLQKKATSIVNGIKAK